MSLKLSDPRVYEPQIRARLGTRDPLRLESSAASVGLTGRFLTKRLRVCITAQESQLAVSAFQGDKINSGRARTWLREHTRKMAPGTHPCKNFPVLTAQENRIAVSSFQGDTINSGRARKWLREMLGVSRSGSEDSLGVCVLLLLLYYSRA